MANYEIPRHRSVRQSINRAAFSYGASTGMISLQRRREARGRRSETIVATFTTLFKLCFVPTIVFSIWVAANSNGGTLFQFLFFVLVAPLFVIVSALFSWTITIISLSLVELLAPVRRTWITRTGHFLTIEEVRAHQAWWAEIAFGNDDERSGRPPFDVLHTASPIDDAVVDKDRAIKELNRSMALSERIDNGARIWVED